MEPAESQFKSQNIFRKGNEEDDRRLSARATTQRHATALAALTDQGAGGTKNTQETPAHQAHNYNAKLDVLKGAQVNTTEQGYSFKGESRPDVVEGGKKRWQYPDIKHSADFYKSGGK